MKTYLGASIYCEYDHGYFKVYIDNGLGKQSEIFFGFREIDALNAFAAHCLQQERDVEEQ